MDLKDLQRNWDEFGRADAMWAILSDPAKRGNRWDREEFFATGVQEIRLALRYVRDLGIDLRTRRALDFGCGVGRLTQALAVYFDEAVGVDIAPSMIEQAQQYNRYGSRCRFVLNAATDLVLFDDNSFDFVYSNLTLQHVAPSYTRLYLAEMLRILRPGGVLLFQLPSSRAERRGLLATLRVIVGPTQEVWRRARYGTCPVAEYHGIERQEVVALLEWAGGEVIETTEKPALGNGWLSCTYCVRKPGP
jgi:SAM-dependent methyltransferase